MKFVADGPDVPDRLIELHEEGQVVFFCGAGISYPAGLPGFQGLVDRLYTEVGEALAEPELLAYKQGRFDAVIDLLERRLADRQRVRRAISRILRPDTSLPGATDTHRALWTLSRARDDRTRLLTTNFDRIFADLEPDVLGFTAPFLPIPKRSKWNGIVYLHGLLPERTDNVTALEHLVVSSGDFGLAYLTERWASRFVTELFRYYTICFVGYSINDPVLRYMLDALSADRLMGEKPIDVYAFGSYRRGKKGPAEEEWRSKGVIPILYKERRAPRGHALLHSTLSEWAKIYRDGLLGKQAIITREARAKPSPVVGDGQVERVLWALCDPSGVPARAFADMTPPPPIEWLASFEERRYSLTDLPRFGIDPRPRDKSLSFSVTHRPSPYGLAPWMALVDTPRATYGHPDEVMKHLARWLARHLDKREVLAWVVRHGGCIHDILMALIDEALLSSNPPPSHIAAVWRIFACGRAEQQSRRPDIFAWRERLRRYGWVTSLRLEFLQLLDPCVRFDEHLASPLDDLEDDHTMPRPRDFARWEIVLRGGDIHSEFERFAQLEGWQDVLASMLPELTERLRDALDLMQELGAADSRHDLSYVHQPSISRHSQNRHFESWTALIELCRDAWLAAVDRRPDEAAQIISRWQRVAYPLFRRLVFFAATEPRQFSASAGLAFLLAEDAWWLWSVETQREAIRLLVSIAPRLDPADADRLLATILRGPPEDLFRDDIEPQDFARARDRDTWLLLEKYAGAGGALNAQAQQRLTEVRERYPQLRLQPEDQDEFPHWMGPDDSWRRKVVLPRELPTLIQALENRPAEDFWYEDNWQELCRSDSELALASLRALAAKSLWPTNVWREALQTFSEDQRAGDQWRALGELLQQAPIGAIREARHSIAWWLRATAKLPQIDQEAFFSLVNRMLDACAEDDVEATDEPVFQAINHAVGQVTEAVLFRWYETKPRDNDKLREPILTLLDRVADPAIHAFRHGRVLLAAHAVALFRIDPTWATANLIPRFDWRDPAEARSAWEGFLWVPRLHKELLKAFKAHALETAAHYDELGKHSEQYAAFLTLAAVELSELFSERELRTALSQLTLEGLNKSANTLLQRLKDVGDQRSEYWIHRIQPFIQRVWPKAVRHRNPNISVALARLCVAAGDSFVASFDLVRGLFVRARDIYLFARDLQQSGRCIDAPETALELLDELVDDTDRGPPEELANCLRQIREARPELADTAPFRRLQIYLTRFNIPV